MSNSNASIPMVAVPVEPTGPYRAEFGAIHHQADAGFLFSIHPESAAKEVARAMNHAFAVEAALSAPAALGALDLYDPKVQQGIAWALGQVGAQLGAEDWAGGDGSESVEGDVADEIGNIMRAAGLVDADGEPLRRDTYRAPGGSVPLDRDALITLIMEEATDDIVADGWDPLGKPNVLVQGCRYVRRNAPPSPEGYANPEAAAKQFAGFIADRVLKALAREDAQ